MGSEMCIRDRLEVERRPLNASEFYDDAQMFTVVVALFKFNYRGVR